MGQVGRVEGVEQGAGGVHARLAQRLVLCAAEVDEEQGADGEHEAGAGDGGDAVAQVGVGQGGAGGDAVGGEEDGDDELVGVVS